MAKLFLGEIGMVYCHELEQKTTKTTFTGTMTEN
jgi:hypothetical protein